MPTDRWPGVESPQRFTTINSLFKARSNEVARAPYFGEFVNDLKAASTNAGVYNRYTYYRLLSQLGTDTGSGESTKLNLNYKNTDGTNLEDYLTWVPTNFFMTVSDRLLKAQFSKTDSNDWFSENLAYSFNTAQGPGPVTTNRRSFYALPYLSGLQVPIIAATNFPEIWSLSSTNIPIYPTNYYNVAVHRLLQVSANLYAATNIENYRAAANSATNSAPYVPIVYRPILARKNGNRVFISGYTADFGDTFINRPWHSLNELANPATDIRDNFYGVSAVVEARKGFPALNEFTVVSLFNVTRKILVTKQSATDQLDQKIPGKDYPVSELLVLSGTNSLGVELVNPYAGAYPRPLRAQIQGRVYTALFDGNVPIQTWTNAYTNVWKIDAGKWKGAVLDNRPGALQVPLMTNLIITLPVGFTGSRTLTTNLTDPVYSKSGQGFNNYDLVVRMTNEFSYVLIDMQGPDRVIDVVSMNRLESSLPITQTLLDNQQERVFWTTNYTRVGVANRSTGAPDGVFEQIRVSRQESEMRKYGAIDLRPGVSSLATEAASFDLFMRGGLDATGLPVITNLQKQTPFTAGGVVFKINSWQANDPLLHHIPEHFYQPDSPGLGVKLSLEVGNVRLGEFQKQGNLLSVRTNWNIGLVNRDEVYTRWGYPPGQDQGRNSTAQELATLFNRQTRDPMVRTPDDWSFPAGKYPGLGWIGKAHRGTAWQSVYLKAGVAGEDWLLDARYDVMKVWPVDLTGKLVGAPTFLNHPTNDWLLVDLFSTSPSTVAGVGAIGVNQDGIAAWSAVLSGVVARTNNLSAVESKLRVLKYLPSSMGFASIQPAMGDSTTPLFRLVDGINRARANVPHGTFASVGQLLSVPELTIASPFLRIADPKDIKRDDYRYGVDEESYEWLPRQILSLVRSDEPRYVIYSFGQALRPAADSLIKDPVSPYYNVCTNYQILAESATKTVVRFEDATANRTTSVLRPIEMRLRPVVESFETLPDESF
ncbi:MAG: hypothetical protein HYR88_13355 [Verrucomicrobia bacterium]|nr:hypothetical protein [Verrucomicrobiota bacterium]